MLLCEEAGEGLLGASWSPTPPLPPPQNRCWLRALPACPRMVWGVWLMAVPGAARHGLHLKPQLHLDLIWTTVLDLNFEPAAIMGQDGWGLGNVVKRKTSVGEFRLRGVKMATLLCWSSRRKVASTAPPLNLGWPGAGSDPQSTEGAWLLISEAGPSEASQLLFLRSWNASAMM